MTWRSVRVGLPWGRRVRADDELQCEPMGRSTIVLGVAAAPAASRRLDFVRRPDPARRRGLAAPDPCHYTELQWKSSFR